MLDQPPGFDEAVLGFRFDGEMIYMRGRARHFHPLGGGSANSVCNSSKSSRRPTIRSSGRCVCNGATPAGSAQIVRTIQHHEESVASTLPFQHLVAAETGQFVGRPSPASWLRPGDAH